MIKLWPICRIDLTNIYLLPSSYLWTHFVYAFRLRIQDENFIIKFPRENMSHGPLAVNWSTDLVRPALFFVRPTVSGEICRDFIASFSVSLETSARVGRVDLGRFLSGFWWEFCEWAGRVCVESVGFWVGILSEWVGRAVQKCHPSTPYVICPYGNLAGMSGKRNFVGLPVARYGCS